MRRLRIVYDGDCPFCRRYVARLRLPDGFDVDLVDARRAPEAARSYGLDLNEGMIADLEGEVHHGADAVSLLARLSERPGPLARRGVARALYPLMRLGRHMTLRLLGRKPI
jgi:predicted DCC family thiol-disulfide oxidoreductase YuxK